MSLLQRLNRGEFVTPGTATTPTYRRLLLIRWRTYGRVPTWIEAALTASLPPSVVGGV